MPCVKKFAGTPWRLLRDETRPVRLQKALQSLGAWGPEQRKQVWSVYRRLHRGLKDLDSWEPLAWELSGLPWPILSTALKVAHGQICVVRLRRAKGLRGAISKAFAQEYLALLRRRLQVLAGTKEPPAYDRWCHGKPVPEQRWTVVCDASARSQASGIGLVLHDPARHTRAEVSHRLSAVNAIEAELHAALLALHTVSTFGAKHVQLWTDAQSVVKAFEGALIPRYSVQEALLQRMARSLDSLEVLRVPRLATRSADALAGRASAADGRVLTY